MWITRRELARLERQLTEALRRAERAEDALRSERERKDSAILELASRVVTKHGGYGLQSAEPKVEAQPPHPKKFTHEPTDVDLAKLEYYVNEYRKAGRSEEEATMIWEAEMRGENPIYPYEEMETEQ